MPALYKYSINETNFFSSSISLAAFFSTKIFICINIHGICAYHGTTLRQSSVKEVNKKRKRKTAKQRARLTPQSIVRWLQIPRYNDTTACSCLLCSREWIPHNRKQRNANHVSLANSWALYPRLTSRKWSPFIDPKTIIVYRRSICRKNLVR